ncbi:MAG: hypothetical protein ACYDCL_11070 [Myxococcales bacterium]
MRRWVHWAAAAAALAACRKAPPADPAEAAYRRAVDLFAKASAETHDLSYRDPQFDAVLEALAEVPAGDELRPKADALAGQIREARHEAELLDREGDERVAAALSEPNFVPLPQDAPMPAAKAAGPSGAERPAAAGGGVWWPTPERPGQIGKDGLPAYYRMAGYFGYGKQKASPASEAPAKPETGATPPPAAAAPTVRSASPPPEAPQGPPSIYGLPGPANRALIGH